MAEQSKGERAPGLPLCRFTQEHLRTEALVPVILEFEQPPVAVFQRLNPQGDAQAYRDQLLAHHDHFLQELANQCIEVHVAESHLDLAGASAPPPALLPHRFTDAFNGIGVLMPGRAVPQVAAMTNVRAVTLNQERVYLTLDKSVPFVGAPQIWERLDRSGLPVKGDGILVAVIDTGLDWTHPAFGGYTEAPNEKVLHAVSLTGEPPMDNFGHGTHVAGIIAGDRSYQGTPRGDSLVDGVAPQARLLSYKVLTAAGSGSASNIVLAIEDAVKRGVHVINLSLGDVQGDPLSPESSAANNAMLSGVVVCAAAGNSGPTPSSVGAPGAAHNVITVGASTDDGVTALQAELILEGEPDRLVEMRLLEGSIPLPAPAIVESYLHCGRGAKAADFPADVKGRIALVERGDVTFREKAMGAQRAGAIACLLYNNQPGGFFGTLGDQEPPTIPVAAISQADGQALRRLAEAPGTALKGRLRLDPEGIPQPDLIAEFSSRGPNKDGWIKPEITAPGVNIFSATVTKVPTPGGGMPDASGYISASGTSMATPHIAGAVALIRQAHPDWTPLMIKAALVNTARYLAGQGTVMDQGGGALNLAGAIDCKAILTTDTEAYAPTCGFGRVAHGDKEKRVSQALRLVALPGYEAETEWTLSIELGSQIPGVEVGLSATHLVVRPGQPARVELALVAHGAAGVEGAAFGWVVATAQEQTLRFPFHAEVSRRVRDEPSQPEQSQPDGQKVLPVRRRVGELSCC